MNVEDVFGEGGLLAGRFPAFERREGQEQMAAAVASSLAAEAIEDENGFIKNRILVVEAETGIGKTLAYLIPAVLSGKRVVVSTATLNLQDQILNKDLPLVEKILGKSFSSLVIKGRQNYLCLYRWYQYRSNPQQSLVEDPRIAKLELWLQTTVLGDRAELSWLGERDHFWMQFTANSSQCLGSDCPEYEDCFITRLRKQAAQVQLLIVNHHLFFSDLALRQRGYGEVLPRYEAVIFDEAHHVENVASTFFGRSWSQFQIIDLIQDLEKEGEENLPKGFFEELRSETLRLRKRVNDFAGNFIVRPGRFPLKEFIEEFGADRWREDVELLALALTRLADKISGFSVYGEVWHGYGKRTAEIRDSFLAVSLGGDENEGEEFIRWYDRKERALQLSATPVDVAPALTEFLYKSGIVCIMTSATLSSGNSFSYMQKRLGLDDDTEFLKFSSPFDYAKRTLLYLPESDFPEPSMDEFRGAFAARVLDLLYISQGRALVLCTSFIGMENLAEELQAKLDYPVLVQGMEAKASLLARFREEKHSVLVAVASFWEGVDVAGEALSCVIIDKLPFEVPSDPVLQAQIARVKEEGGNPFFSFQIPRAILTLRQGVGRLMRTSSDSGVVAIMDVRLIKKGYGKNFLKSLPPSPKTYSLDEVEAFFHKTW